MNMLKFYITAVVMIYIYVRSQRININLYVLSILRYTIVLFQMNYLHFKMYFIVY